MKYVTDPRFFPTLLIIISLFSAIGYIPTGDWRKMLYWFAAAILNFVVTW